MRIKQFLQPCVMLGLAGTMSVATAQGLLPTCSSLPAAERDSARAIGACREAAPIVDMAPKAGPTAPAAGSPVVTLVPNVVGLSFDEARARLPGFNVQRSYMASAEPGGKILEQQPAPPARLATGSTIRVVVSDGTLRPTPRVAATEIDAIRRPEAPQVLQQPAPPPLPADAPTAQTNTEARKPAATNPGHASRTMEVRRPLAPPVAVSPRKDVALSKVSPERVEPVTAPSKVAARTAPVETFELPNVVGRSSAEATAALAEFKIERVEIVANAAPSGQVLGQDPKPGTAVAAGSAIGLQVSDGSLASASVAAPASVAAAASTVAPASSSAAPTPGSAAAPAAPMQTRAPTTFPSTAVLLLIAGVLAGLGLGALLMRRWLAKRHSAADDLDSALVDFACAIDERTVAAPAPSIVGGAVAATTSPARAIAAATAALGAPAVAPIITFTARLEDEGAITIEFAAPSDAEEMALEYSRGLDE